MRNSDVNGNKEKYTLLQYANKVTFSEKNVIKQKPKHLFLAQVNRYFCLLSRNLRYPIQEIVLVLLRVLRVVGLGKSSLCNATTMLAVEVLVGVDAGRQQQ